MKRLLSVLLLTVLGFGSRMAFGENSCESRLTVSFVKFTKSAFLSGKISLEKLKAVAKSPIPINPLQNQTPVSSTASLQKYYAYVTATVSSEGWSRIRLDLEKLLGEIDRDSAAAEIARQATKAVLAPKEITLEVTETHPMASSEREDHDRFVVSYMPPAGKGIRADYFKPQYGNANILRVEFPDGTKTEISAGLAYIRSAGIYRSQRGDIYFAVGSQHDDNRKIEVFNLRKSRKPLFVKDYPADANRFDFSFFEHEGNLFLAAHIHPNLRELEEYTEFFEPLQSDSRILSFPGMESHTWMGVREVDGQLVMLYQHVRTWQMRVVALFESVENRNLSPK